MNLTILLPWEISLESKCPFQQDLPQQNITVWVISCHQLHSGAWRSTVRGQQGVTLVVALSG